MNDSRNSPGIRRRPATRASALWLALALLMGQGIASQPQLTSSPATPDSAPASGALSLDAPGPLLLKSGTPKPQGFAALRPRESFDVQNPGPDFMMVAFEPNPDAQLWPPLLRLAPNERRRVRLAAKPGIGSFTLRYAVARAAAPFQTHNLRYRAYSDGETVMCVPVAPALQRAIEARARSILNDSMIAVTDKKAPAGTRIYTPGPYYRRAGLFARDFLFQLEGAGRYGVSAEAVKQAVDLLALKQLPENRRVGPCTYSKGAIPDHVYPDGRYSGAPANTTATSPATSTGRPWTKPSASSRSGWHYGFKAGWDAAWRRWFEGMAGRFDDAWESVPRNPRTGLVTQWTTRARTSPQGITETNGACIMWGFHYEAYVNCRKAT